ncbi:hypothetical protein EV06_0864 [Prochlorococcus sp. MIT 0602]|nr:hypothetical protein EV06_0864 [Prochlorococcus sp. MIT 0602]KGG17274.1 hypothetical protein EV07_0712 [Prochlorococcus sp. MIT 0603]
MFGLSLLTAYFTLQNTASTTVNLLPGVSGSLPIAALVIISSGIGACGAWFFASWTDKLRGDEIKELQNTKSRIKELEVDLIRLKTKQNNIFPFTSFSSDKLPAQDHEAA